MDNMIPSKQALYLVSLFQFSRTKTKEKLSETVAFARKQEIPFLWGKIAQISLPLLS